MEDRFDRILAILALVVIAGVLIVAANSKAFQKSKYSISRVEAASNEETSEDVMMETLASLQIKDVTEAEDKEADAEPAPVQKTQLIVAPTVNAKSLDEEGNVEDAEAIEETPAAEEPVKEEAAKEEVKEPESEPINIEETASEDLEPVQEIEEPEAEIVAETPEEITDTSTEEGTSSEVTEITEETEKAEEIVEPVSEEEDEKKEEIVLADAAEEISADYNYQVLSRVRGLSVRTKPDLDSAILGTLRGNDLIECVNDSYKDWIQIKYNGVLAFVAKQYVTAIEN